jgi:hypothetical protein
VPMPSSGVNINANAEAACLIKRGDPPINIIGGHKFPGAPIIDLASPHQRPLQLQHLNDSRSQISDDLSIPSFLKREPGP